MFRLFVSPTTIFTVASLVILSVLSKAGAADNVIRNTDKAYCNPPDLEEVTGISTAEQYCIEHQGITRCWYTYIPPSLLENNNNNNNNTETAIVIDPHGFNLCASEQANFSGWDKTADEHGFIVVWPQGNLNAEFSNDPSWDFGMCCSSLGEPLNGTGFPPRAEDANIDDIGFIQQLISNVQADVLETHSLRLDLQRIYMAGHSNGCMFSQAMAALSDTPAAVCCVASSLMPSPSEDYQPTPVQVVYGSLDTTIGFFFGSNDHILNTWGPLNECEGEGGNVTTNTEDDSGLYVTRRLSNCTADVETVEIYDVGHFAYLGLPPVNQYSTFEYPGAITPAVDSTALAWEFCSPHANPIMPQVPDPVPFVSADTYVPTEEYCTEEYKPVVCSSSSGTKEVFSNSCIASRDGNYTNVTTECKLIELLSVKCTNPYALCAKSNCTVNPDERTASCGCYGFDDDAAKSISSMRIALIPDEGVKYATIEACANSTTGCDDGPFGNDMVDATPVCDAIRDNALWPGSDLVSTFSFQPQLPPLNNDETWTCEAKPGQFVPVCMLAPCRYSNSEPIVTCTCPLVEVTDEYDIAAGGLRFPCSNEQIVSEGLYMQVVMWTPGLVAPAWAVVEDAFTQQAPTTTDVPSNAPTTTSPTKTPDPPTDSPTTRPPTTRPTTRPTKKKQKKRSKNSKKSKK
mmetsp:Transcript_57356/g.66236  ORF Transcript_57356/g.66236 Transcript_57356/m.66236 type:complete len:685 (-) Transcript_57356:295-2349(-)